MIKKILEELEKFDQTENAFGKEVIEAVSYEETKEAFVVRLHEYPPVVLMKSESFRINYFSLIMYLTEMKNRMMNGEDPVNPNKYYYDWLTFKKSYNICKAWFYLNIQDVNDAMEIIELFIRILGKINYKAVVAGSGTPNTDYDQHASIVMEYIGNTRAVRDLSMKYLDDKYGTQWQFHLWNMMAHYLIDKYGNIFYLGNELSSLDFCPYTYRAEEYYYDAFYERLHENAEKRK